MVDCLRTGKPFRYITNTKANSAVYLSAVVKSSLSGWGYGKTSSFVLIGCVVQYGRDVK